MSFSHKSLFHSGMKGDEGALGDRGKVGKTGPVGVSGEKGSKGAPGYAGQDGAYGLTVKSQIKATVYINLKLCFIIIG